MNRTAVRTPLLALALVPAAALSGAAAAHHGWAWTDDQETRLSGTIQSISFGNPHMHLQVRTESGNVWEVDLSPPIVAQRSGFGPGAAKAGDTVVLTGHRARDRDVRAFKAETVTVGGKSYDVYPQRPKSLKPDA